MSSASQTVLAASPRNGDPNRAAGAAANERPSRTRAIAGACEVAPAGAHDDRSSLDLVAHRDAPLRDARQRPGARVLDEPLRAADRRRAVAPRRAEGAAAVAPQLALLRSPLRGPRPAASTAHQLGEPQVGDAARLRDEEEPVEEPRRLRRRAGSGTDVSSTTPLRVSTVEPIGMPCAASRSTNSRLPRGRNADAARDLADDDGPVRHRRGHGRRLSGARRRGQDRRGRWAFPAGRRRHVLVGARVAELRPGAASRRAGPSPCTRRASSRAALSAGIGSTGVCPPSPTSAAPRPAVVFCDARSRSRSVDSTLPPSLIGLIGPQFDGRDDRTRRTPTLPVLRATIEALTWTVPPPSKMKMPPPRLELAALSATVTRSSRMSCSELSRAAMPGAGAGLVERDRRVGDEQVAGPRSDDLAVRMPPPVAVGVALGRASLVSIRLWRISSRAAATRRDPAAAQRDATRDAHVIEQDVRVVLRNRLPPSGRCRRAPRRRRSSRWRSRPAARRRRTWSGSSCRRPR